MQIYNKEILDNGLKVICHKMPKMQSAALGVWIATGGRYEDMKKRGISHFVEHLLFKGTKKRTALQIKNSIEGIGGALNGFTSEEVTCYFVKVPGKHLKLGLDVLSDMVLNPRFDMRDIDKERYVILEEIKMYKDLPDHYVNELLSELLWPDGVLGIPLTGTFESVNSLKRSDIIEYKEKSYNPSKITIVACGDIDWQAFSAECTRIFARKSRGRIRGFKKIKVSQDKPNTKIFYKDTEQTHVAIGFHSLSRHNPSRYAMDILNIILGANMSSRLFHELREKRGLAYAIGSHVDYFADGGVNLIDAGVDNKKIADAIRLILKELSKLKRFQITSKEFDMAKEYYQGHLSFMLEDTVSHMLWLGRKIVTGDEPIDAEEIIKRIRRVTMDEIQELSRRIFKRKSLNIAVIGPTTDREREEIEGIAHEF